MAASPLRPRSDSTGVWTGTEMLVLGGRHYTCATACGGPPGPEAYERTVAAYDPAKDNWRKLAPTPFAPTDIAAVVIGRKVFVLTGTIYSKARLYLYDLDADAWRALATQPKDSGPDQARGIVAAGDRLFAWYPYPRDRHPADLLYDPARNKWTAAPKNPLGRSLNREVLGLPDGRVISVGTDAAGTGDPKTAYNLGPRFYNAAALDPETGAWKRLPKPRSVDR